MVPPNEMTLLILIIQTECCTLKLRFSWNSLGFPSSTGGRAFSDRAPLSLEPALSLNTGGIVSLFQTFLSDKAYN